MTAAEFHNHPGEPIFISFLCLCGLPRCAPADLAANVQVPLLHAEAPALRVDVSVVPRLKTGVKASVLFARFPSANLAQYPAAET